MSVGRVPGFVPVDFKLTLVCHDPPKPHEQAQGSALVSVLQNSGVADPHLSPRLPSPV